MKKRKPPKANKKATLCWRCKKASGGYDCEWARKENYEPVPGWKAKQTTVLIEQSRTVDSFLVLRCPKFKEG